jgi:hypothetical protein
VEWCHAEIGPDQRGLACVAGERMPRASLRPTDGQSSAGSQVLKGKAALGDWRQDKPGLRRHLTLQDLPPIGKSTPNFSEIADARECQAAGG